MFFRLALAGAVLALCSADAMAFGKRCGGGLFGRRAQQTVQAPAPATAYASNSCVSGDCGPQTGFSSFTPSFAPYTPNLSVSGGVKTWVNEYGVTMTCDANGCRPVATRAALVAGVNCPCVAANGYCPCASPMNQKAEPPKTIQAYGRTYTLQP